MKLSLIVCLAIVGHCAFAQILNVNKLDVTHDSSGYFTGYFDFAFDFDNRSPTPDEPASYLGVESSLDLVRIGKENAYFFIGSLNHYRATGDPVISTGYLHVRINFQRKRRFSYEAYAQSLFDHSRHLENRSLGGGGIKYRLYKDQIFEVDFGTGGFYEWEEWLNLARDNTYTYNRMVKSSNYLKINVTPSENSLISFVTFYQTGYDGDISAWRNRVSVSAQLEMNFGEKFSFIVEAGLSHEDKPILEINKTIYSISNGFRLNF